MGKRPAKQPDRGYYFKFYSNSDVKLIRYLLEDNGFIEANSSQAWTMQWSCCTLKSDVFQFLGPYQKVNHFPKSIELTRKDCMYRNLARMEAIHGNRHYDFLPKTFLLPNEAILASEEMEKNKSKFWIVKPAASSQGKGIFVTSNFNDVCNIIRYLPRSQ